MVTTKAVASANCKRVLWADYMVRNLQGGTVISCAWRELYPRPLTIDGANSDRLEKGHDLAK
jgi:hypothetical protein